MKQTPLKRKTPLKSKPWISDKKNIILPKYPLKKRGFKRKILDFNSESPENPMLVLDRIFSEVIRRQFADERGLVSCYTCGIQKHWKEMQCGHFRPRQHLGTRYLEENCKVQCPHCNCVLEGNLEEFAYRLTQEYGDKHVEDLYALSASIIPSFPWEYSLSSFKAKLAVLVAEQENSIEY